MSSIFPVYEGDGSSTLPRYPTVIDFGGLGFENDPKFVPQPGKRLRAENYMQLSMAVDRVCRMEPTLTIEFAPGFTGYTPDAPTILSVTSVIDAITLDSVLINRSSQGIYVIYYPPDKMPPKRQMMQIWPCESDGLYAYGQQASGHVYVHTMNQSGNPTDDPQFKFKVRIFGE